MSLYTLRDWAVDYDILDTDMTKMIENLTKKSGLLKTMMVQPASHNMFHRYALAENLPTAGFRLINGSITPSKATSKIQQEDLVELNALDERDKRLVESSPLQNDAVFASDSPQYIESMGQTLSKQFFYGTTGAGDADGYQGLRQLAIANSKSITGSGTEGSSTTIFAVRWQKGVMTGLFDPSTFNSGNPINMEMVSDGKPYPAVTNVSTGAKKFLYGMLYSASLGLLGAGIANVACYTRIQDDTSDKPTAANMDKLIELIEGYSNTEDTFIYLNGRALRLLQELKVSKLTTAVYDEEHSTWLRYWDTIPLIVDDNLINTEDYS